MLRTLSSFIKSYFAMAAPPRMVPIPRNGVDYRGKVVLAPMVRSGEIATRLLSLKYGADLVWGPETVDKAIIGAKRYSCPRTNTVYFTRTPNHGNKMPEENTRESVIYRLHPEREGKRLVFQMGTATPELAVQAARVVAGDVAGIDVNSGCPKPFSTLGGMGAALLKEPDRLCAILEALVKEIASEFEIGISVKIRILETPEETEALVKRLVETGITGLTVHCRTTPMRPRERAIRDQLKMIAAICRKAGVACLMNGDIENRDQAIQLIQEFGVDGAMIATAAEKNPSVFRTQAEGGTLPWKEVIRTYVETAFDVQNRWANTKFLLSQIMSGKDASFMAVQQAKSHEEIVRRLGFDDLFERANELDTITGLADQLEKSNYAKKKKKARGKRHAEDSRPNPHSQQSQKKPKTVQRNMPDQAVASAIAI